MRADRLLTILLLLQSRGRLTAPELAAELEVSVRTVYRDLDALGAAGVPVTADRGPAGGYRLMDGYRTRLTGLTDAEAGSLFLVGAPGPAAELGLGAELATARLKLQAALPDGLARRSRLVQERFHLDAPAWFRDADPVPHLAAVARAVWEAEVVRADYRRWNGELRRRTLQPLGLVLKGGIWYVAARVGGGEPPGAAPPVRTYRVSRLLDVEPTGEHFERPVDFDLAGYWTQQSRRLEDALLRHTARIRLSPRGQRLLPMQFGAAGARALAGAGEPDGAGWVEVDLAVETEAVAVGDLLRLGVEAEVLGPPALRAAVGRAARVLAGRYEECGAGPGVD
ncbi:helix-turn-helix transcriptional regulator [Streptomyces antimicrobicus]|uniref:WYL domain-containing protein n=1 Tax=Streptomyces antimicrobicus TaxID=2883108 RepID=A0ABS8BAZ9_9ACTN|nr:WYL domain-containing protein [Streptomyces antimicrobicus]MCB5181812.1 WYL domain-containing protein [Streptomyces antimicrobicus]